MIEQAANEYAEDSACLGMSLEEHIREAFRAGHIHSLAVHSASGFLYGLLTGCGVVGLIVWVLS